MAAAQIDYAQAGELKIGQVGIANLRVRTLDVAQLAQEMRERVQRAPKLFDRAAVVVDFGGLAQTPDVATARALIEALREAGVIPVALSYGSSDNEKLAIELGLPLLAKFRAQYEPVGGASVPTSAVEAAPARAETVSPKAAPAPIAHGGQPGLIQTAPVRSGQQVYADNRDLTVLTTVGAGAEVLADGSVHIYGALRGRALAGAQGNEKARIFCREFHAELVAVAGHYKVLEDIPKELRGKAVQIWLEDGQLKIAALDN
ncbi:septum site-determining protein MinC [Luteimonas cucumeris]|uniref:septum site-determining protein MinC n=1 Tax=Luteimonas cucumeris TaxID=985012 RepID=UPI00119CA3E9|nr:septum site-determining protein MinC [Luteimonas cucumeris]